MMTSWPPNKLLIKRLSSVNSTNETAINLLKNKEYFNWIIADQQIDGRGRRGNIWSSPMGGLYATTVISDAKLDYSHVSQLSILSAVVAAKTIEDIIGKNDKNEAFFSYLQEVQKNVTVEECLNKLIINFNKMINIWNYGESFTHFKDYWLMLTRDHGRVIKAKKKNITIEGVFENIDDKGNLILRVGSKKEIIDTGEIFS
jgi:biotin-(acetyl-CoA carboxylase) ligase